jgi:hypothetical protein
MKDGGYMLKKIVKTYKGDELPPQTKEYADDSRNPFELFAEDQGEFGCIQVFVSLNQGKTWTEVVTFYA